MSALGTFLRGSRISHADGTTTETICPTTTLKSGIVVSALWTIISNANSRSKAARTSALPFVTTANAHPGRVVRPDSNPASRASAGSTLSKLAECEIAQMNDNGRSGKATTMPQGDARRAFLKAISSPDRIAGPRSTLDELPCVHDLAERAGITPRQARELIDRYGCDQVAIDEQIAKLRP